MNETDNVYDVMFDNSEGILFVSKNEETQESIQERMGEDRKVIHVRKLKLGGSSTLYERMTNL